MNRQETRSQPHQGERHPGSQPKKSAISGLRSGDFFEGDVKIMRRAKPGPVIFQISDGAGMIDAVTRDAPFDTGAVVRLSGQVGERGGRLQIEIKSIRPSTLDFDTILDQQAIPLRTRFSIPSDRYETMKTPMLRVAQRIRRGIFNGQPILIRHHNDSDGINAGLAMEQAITRLMNRVGINPQYNLSRSPSRAPFYEVADVLRDVVHTKRLTDGFGQKHPLILVLDNGSTPEDLFGMKTMQALGNAVIVIDHHNPVHVSQGQSTVCPYLLDHINPYLWGLDSKTSAGMLCYEIARFIDETFEHPALPAVAAISDRCDIPETEAYIQNTGQTREALTRIGIAIDFIAYHMKHQPGQGLIETLYATPAFVDLILEQVRQGEETQLQSALPYLRTQKIQGVAFSHIDLEKYTLRFTYPTPGKVLGKIHDQVVMEQDPAPALTLGYLSDMIIIRANQPVLPVQEIIARLQVDIPEANVDGGGHEMAGTIKFVSAHQAAILERIKSYLTTNATQWNQKS
jgi:RecJ-like exonuclease